jgi:periplasmic protein TonB
MLDYAVAQNQKHGPSRRVLICLITSCLAHLLFFVTLIEFPQLLEAGYYNQFRGLQRNSAEEEEEAKNWRTVAILESPKRMNMPSAAALKKYLYPEKKGSGAPPIRVNLGNLAAALAKLPSLPKSPAIDKDSKIPVHSNEKPPVLPETKPVVQAATPGNGEKDYADTGSGMAISTQKAEPKIDIAANPTPSRIPDSIKLAASTPTSTANTIKVQTGEQKSAQSSGIGIFDDKGFPLGEYKDLIVERVKARWFIPSNLKNSQGRTTLIFHIDKEGRCVNLRVTTRSGSNSLDLAALSAVTEANPFPPLPKGFPGDHIGVKLVLIVEP